MIGTPPPYETLWKAPRTLDAALGVDLTWREGKDLGSNSHRVLAPVTAWGLLPCEDNAVHDCNARK
jgi:hypothetical protein